MSSASTKGPTCKILLKTWKLAFSLKGQSTYIWEEQVFVSFFSQKVKRKSLRQKVPAHWEKKTDTQSCVYSSGNNQYIRPAESQKNHTGKTVVDTIWLNSVTIITITLGVQLWSPSVSLFGVISIKVSMTLWQTTQHKNLPICIFKRHISSL